MAAGVRVIAKGFLGHQKARFQIMEAGFFVPAYFFGAGALLTQVQLGSRWQVPSPMAVETLPGLQVAAAPTGQLTVQLLQSPTPGAAQVAENSWR